MISISTLVWAVAGVMAGGAHSLGVKHSAEKANEWVAMIGLLRLLFVAVVLSTAAIFGFLFSAFAGWILGFAVTLAILFWKVN